MQTEFQKLGESVRQDASQKEERVLEAMVGVGGKTGELAQKAKKLRSEQKVGDNGMVI